LTWKDGIWQSGKAHAVSYPNERRGACFELETQSFWFNHRNACILAVLKRFEPKGMILDVGGGNGFVTQMLVQEGYEAVLVEPGLQSCLHARQRGIPYIACALVEELCYEDNAARNVTAFDVLEHVPDERGFLATLHRAVSASGKLFLTVPAFPSLWSVHDEAAGHCRRYTIDSLRAALESANFTVLGASYFFRPLWPLRFLFGRLSYLAGIRHPPKDAARQMQKQHLLNSGLARSVLHAALRSEIKVLSKGRTIPYGTSLICAAQKT
jgi:SAM-dependent methyltransferase